MPVCQLSAQNLFEFLSGQGARLHLPTFLVVRDSRVANSYQSSVAKAGERDQAAGAYSNCANRHKGIETWVLGPGSLCGTLLPLARSTHLCCSLDKEHSYNAHYTESWAGRGICIAT